MRKNTLGAWFVKLACLTFFCGWAVTATAQPVYELRLAHYLPPMHHMAAKVLPGWAERLEKASNGRLKVTIYPAEQLLGVSEIFDGVRAGVADLGWSMPGALQGGDG